jgi:hypothetical protein
MRQSVGLGRAAELAGEPPNAVAGLRLALAGPAASLAQAAVFGGVALAISYSGESAVAVAAHSRQGAFSDATGSAASSTSIRRSPGVTAISAPTGRPERPASVAGSRLACWSP